MKKTKKSIKWWAVLIWLTIWQLMSIVIGQEILLVSPVSVFIKIFELIFEYDFWLSIQFSILRILGGFLLAIILGIVLGAIASKYRVIRDLLEPFVKTIKAIPVASFVILVLIWISSENLSVVISFLTVFPIIYANILEGIANTDKKLLDMAKVFDMSLKQKVRYIYISEVLPFFQSACSVSLGMCWKAGVAAEVIGLPNNSIGENLYEAKIFLDTTSLFAWTVTIICISMIFEKLFTYIVRKFIAKLEHTL